MTSHNLRRHQGNVAMTPKRFPRLPCPLARTSDTQHALAMQTMLPSPPGGTALGTNHGEEHLLGVTSSTACSNAKGWVKRGICDQLSTLRQLALILELQ